MAIRRLFIKIVVSVVVALVLIVVGGDIVVNLYGTPADEPRNVSLLLRLATAATIVIGLCWWLARHMTVPIARLVAATEQLAAGDLRTRVATVLGPRQDELGDLGLHFDAMAARIEALILSERRLIRDVSHELRSPLARLNVAAGLARRHAGPEVSSQLDRIEREAERLNQLIGQLLMLARLETGAESAQRVNFDLAMIVDEVAADADFEARGRKRAVRVIATEPCPLTGFPELMRSAVENVVRNAIRFTAVGSSVDITLRRLSDGTEPVAILVVQDHGHGVPASALPHLFEPFYRVSLDRRAHPESAGLGLAITQRAVQLHGGSVSAGNDPGGGLVLTFALPLRNISL